MKDHSEKFQVLLDEPVSTHLRNQSFTDGRRESWATETEIMAASALYGVNIKVKVKCRGRYVWHTYTYRADGNFEQNTAIPHEGNVLLIFNTNHYNLLLHVPTTPSGADVDDSSGASRRNERPHFDWFDLTMTGSQPPSPEDGTADKTHKQEDKITITNSKSK